MMRPMRASSSTTESAYFDFDSDLCSNSGAGRFGWCTFMKLTLMKNGLSGLAGLVEEVERRLLDVLVEEGNADHPLVGRVDVLAVDLEVLLGGLARLAGERALGHLANIARSSGSMSGNQVGSA